MFIISSERDCSVRLLLLLLFIYFGRSGHALRCMFNPIESLSFGIASLQRCRKDIVQDDSSVTAAAAAANVAVAIYFVDSSCGTTHSPTMSKMIFLLDGVAYENAHTCVRLWGRLYSYIRIIFFLFSFSSSSSFQRYK